jgi:hypothetical protein
MSSQSAAFWGALRSLSVVPPGEPEAGMPLAERLPTDGTCKASEDALTLRLDLTMARV